MNFQKLKVASLRALPKGLSNAGVGLAIFFLLSGCTLKVKTAPLVLSSPSPLVKQLVFKVQPSAITTAGIPFSIQPVVSATDAGGKTVTNYQGAITLTAYSGKNCSNLVTKSLTATLNPVTAVTAVNGVSTFSGVTVLKTSVQSLLASDGTLFVCSNAVSILPGALSTLSFSTNPASAAASGSAFAIQPVVTASDANGNALNAGTSITLSLTSGAPAFACSVNPVSTNISGNAIFSGCKFTGAIGNYTLTATSNLMNVVSTGIVLVSAPTQVSITAISNSAISGVNFTTQPTVQLQDALNALVAPATNPITLSTYTDVACTVPMVSGELNSDSNPLLPTGGTATFSNFFYGGQLPTIYIGAASPGLTSACSGAISISSVSVSFGGTIQSLIQGTSSSLNSVPVYLTAAQSKDTVVYYSVLPTGTTAINPVNFNLTSGTVTIPAGVTTANINYTWQGYSVKALSLFIQLGISGASHGVMVGSLSTSQIEMVNPLQLTFAPLWSGSGGGLANHSCGLISGALYCWGDNSYGQLGNGNTTQQNTPVLINAGTSYSQVAVGGGHTCAVVASTGALHCFGFNFYGQLGNGNTSNQSSPVVVNAGTSYSQVTAGVYHTCALVASTGALQCFGYNSTGQLGNGNTSNQSSPVAINAGTFYSKIAAGGYHTCAVITSTGALQCWGFNASGQLGNGNTTNQINAVAINAGTAYSKIAASANNTCGVITSTGALQCWGNNGSGQLGIGNTINQSSPVAVNAGTSYSQVAIGANHTCAIVTSSGVLQCFGDNSKGQIGIGNTTQQNSPVVVNAGTSYSQISAGQSHSCATISSSGALQCFGDNSLGQSGKSLNLLLPEQGGANTQTFTSLSVGSGGGYAFHSCGISGGSLYCWGKNNKGQIGNGNTSNQTLPIQINPGTTYSQVSAGLMHTCAINSSGTLHCFGDASFGQLGTGNTTQKINPSVINAGTSYSSVSAGNVHTCAITASGVLQCWGYNSKGQIGNGNTTQQNSPVVIDAGTSYLQVTTGQLHTCAITTSGALKCWGCGNQGQIGNGLSSNQSNPVAINVGTTYSQIVTGGAHTCALT